MPLRTTVNFLKKNGNPKLSSWFLTTPDAAVVPKGPIRFYGLFLDESSEPFAQEVKGALDSGWHSNNIERDVVLKEAKIPFGIALVVHDAKVLPEHLGVLEKASLAAGLRPGPGENPNVPEGIVAVYIGVKPLKRIRILPGGAAAGKKCHHVS